MKKLLLIFTIMLTFSITTVSVSATETIINPGTEIRNIIPIFANDYDNNGLAGGWVDTVGTTINKSFTDYVQTFQPIQQYNGIKYVLTDEIKANSVLYIQAEIKTTAPEVGLNLSDGLNFDAKVEHTGTGAWEIIKYTQEITTYNGSGYIKIKSDHISSYADILVKEVILVDLTAAFGSGFEPSADEFSNMLKNGYFSGTVTADEIINFDNNTRINHYLYEAPDIFEDFPNNITLENMIRIAFFVPLMIIFYLLIPLFNFVLSGSATGFVLLSLLILAFILREVIRFIDPDFHLFGKNSYHDGYNRSKSKD